MMAEFATDVNETTWAMAERLGTIISEREVRRFGEVRTHFGARPT